MDSTTDGKLAEAYECGDIDEILRLLGVATLSDSSDLSQKPHNSQPPIAEHIPSICAPATRLTASAKEFVPSARAIPGRNPVPNPYQEAPIQNELLDHDNCCVYDGDNSAVQGEHEYLFTDADYAAYPGINGNDGTEQSFGTQALVNADPDAAALDAASRVNYVAAVATFDAEFPALDGKPGSAKSDAAPRASVGADADAQGAGSLLARMRLERLQGMFGWIDGAIVARTLDGCGGSLLSAEAALSVSYPRPAWWDAQQRAITDAASAASAARRARGAVPRRTRDVGASWVSTGDSVRALYERLRAEAGVEARARNAAFDRAREAALRGDRASAARFGAVGREANDRMKALHTRAADAIFDARNPPGAAESGLVDLHGLHVAEALERLPDAVGAVRTTTARILTGSGHHTKGTGKARLRPAVRQWLDAEGFRYEEVVDKNSHVGAFVVHL